MKAQTEITIRFADCDPMGHTNNAKYFTYMEQARVTLFKDVFKLEPGKPIVPENFPFILAEISCRFLKPTFVNEILTIEARITELKNSSFFIEYEFKDKKTGDLVATGKSVQVWFDYKTGKSKPIPEDYRNKLTD